MQAIARRAGASVGSLYQYFATKEALIDACAEREMRRCLARLESGLPALFSMPLRQAAAEAVRGLIANCLVDEALLRALLARGQRLEGVSEFQERAVNLIHLYLHGRTCRVHGPDPGATAFVLVHGVNAVIAAALQRRPDDLRNDLFGSELTRLVLAYLAPWDET